MANFDVQEIGSDRFLGLAVPELAQAYPEGEMFGILPAYSLYARHVDGLTVSNWRGRWERKDLRPAATLDDVSGVQILGLHAGAVAGPQPVILLHNVDGALIESVSVGQPDAFLLQAEGARSRKIAVFAGNEPHYGGNGLEVFDGTPRSFPSRTWREPIVPQAKRVTPVS